MFRSPRSRNNGRNKGIKIKHVFQISLLLGVSLWLLYQVHHSDDRKGSNITHKLRNVHSKDMYKLGRKDLRPKVNGKNSSEENQSDEQGNENEEVAHDDHEREEGEVVKHDEVGENEHADDPEKEDGNEKNTKVVYDDKEKGREKSGGKNEKIQTEHKGERKEDGGKKSEGTKDKNGSEKSGEKGNKGNKKDNKKEKIKLKSQNKDEGRKKEMEQLHKQNDGGEQVRGDVNEDKSNEQNKLVGKSEKMSPNTKELEISSPPESHDQSVGDETENDKMADKGKRENGSGEDDTSPYSYSVPSFVFETANSVNDDGDSEGQDKEQISKENDDGSVLEEKDALTDLGTLPEIETGGSISHDVAATE